MKFYTENRFTKLSLLIVCLFIIGTLCSAQTIGDFRSVSTGEWTTLTTWQTYTSTGWVAATNYPGQNTGNYSVTIESGNTISISGNNFTTNPMGTITIIGKLILNNNSTSYLNSEEIYVTPNLLPIPATIQFDNKSILALPTNAVLEVWENGLSGNNFNHNQEIHVGIVYLAAGEGAPGADYFTFEELMQAGGTLNAKANVPPMSCLGDPVALVGNYSGAIGDPVTYSWSSTGPAPLDFIPTSTAKEPTVVPTVAGSYTISLTVSTKKGILLYNNTEKVTLIVVPTSSVTNKTICSNEIPYIWDGLTFYNSGIQSVTSPNIAGCDSVSTLILSVNTPTTSTTTDSICLGNNYVFNGITYTTPGNYSSILTNSEGCDSIAYLNLIPCMQSSQTLCPITVSDIKVCPNTNGQLNASDADYYYWSPSAGLSDTTIANPVVNVPTTTTYNLTAFTEGPTNLIVNGNFENGNLNFSSNYTYTNSNLIPEGYYAVGTNPNAFHNSFSTCGDHTSGSGKMLVVNGNTAASSKIWGQTITVEQYKYYAFYAYVTPVHSANPPIIQFSINGSVLGTPFNSPGTTCTWNKFYAIWYSGANTTADISIVNQNIIANGNDFAIDDIKYVELCKTMEDVTVTVGPTFSVTDLAVCSSDLPYVWNGIPRSSEGTYSFSTQSVIGCDSTAVLNLSVNVPTIAPIENQTICQGDSVLFDGFYFKNTGTYFANLTNHLGCDSIRTLNLTVLAASSIENKTICERDLPFVWNMKNHMSSGTFKDTLVNSLGCDSIATLELTVIPTTYSTTPVSVCQKDLPYIWNTKSYTQSGIFKDTLVNSVGCDSVAILNLTVNPTPTVTNIPLIQTICSGESTTTITLTSDVASTTFEWTASTDTGITGFTDSGTGPIPAQALTNPDNTTTGTVTYVITPTANGCTGTTVEYVITVTPKPITSYIYHQ